MLLLIPAMSSAMLIYVASVGYAKAPAFPPCSPSQFPMEQRIFHALKHQVIFREAMKKEGLDVDGVPDVIAYSRKLDVRSRL